LESAPPIGSRQFLRPSATTAGWRSKATNGLSSSTSRRSGAWHPGRMQRDGQPAVDAGALRGLEVLQGATDFCLQREILLALYESNRP
jgi:hypothetical protein